jgi:hypothetical protein
MEKLAAIDAKYNFSGKLKTLVEPKSAPILPDTPDRLL